MKSGKLTFDFAGTRRSQPRPETRKLSPRGDNQHYRLAGSIAAGRVGHHRSFGVRQLCDLWGTSGAVRGGDPTRFPPSGRRPTFQPIMAYLVRKDPDTFLQ